MTPRWGYMIKPLGSEYNNSKKYGEVDFIVNTTIEDAQYVNRLGIVSAAPKGSEISVGSKVITHHNVFRTYFDMKGNQRKSNEYFRDEAYIVDPEKIYMYDSGQGWRCTKDYVFVAPIPYLHNGNIYRSDKEKEEHVGIIKHSSVYPEGTQVGFTKNSEYQFEIDGEKIYRMRLKDICIKFD